MKTSFTTVRTEGGILPADLLTKIVQRHASIGGVSEDSYHVSGEKLNEAISRSWNRLLGVWRAFEEAKAKLPENDFGTTITREKWLLPVFEELRYGRLKARTFEIDGAAVPISHGWENVPIHLVGFRISIDRRTPGAAGAAKKSPHSLLQEFLNRSPEHVWGIVANGETLRILRDNVALTRQAFVEFDLRAMMEGEVYSDFALLWMLCHQSRVDAAKPEEFWLERWSKVAQDVGVRALEQLREGVSKAIEVLGGGFLAHRDNERLRQRLASGELDKQEYYRQLLRLVYRFLFLFVAEDRDLLLARGDEYREARERYLTYYSTHRLRQQALRRRGSHHVDLFEQLRFVFDCLGRDEGCEALSLKPLGSFLWSEDATAALNACSLANADLLTAVRSLSVLKDGRVTRVVDFRNLRSEELGSVYEALLEMHPEVHLDSGTFELKTAAGNERKTTGSYYTPESLVQLLLDSALDPVLAEAAAKPNPEEAILALKVCDPACGSGHFLIAAAHRIAKKLASVRTGDEEANPEAVRKALRDVIGHCIHGVDINPMAVELCKVALWMEALDPGRPLSFLEQKIQCGNSLLGATPELLAKGIPDAAFDPIEGDDKEVCKQAKAQNKKYRETKQATFDFTEPWNRLGDLATGVMQLDDSSDETLADVRKKEQRWKELVESTGYLFGQLWADAWCAAFVWKKTTDNLWPITEETFRKIEHNPYSVDAEVRDEIRRLAARYQFFHWHLRFPAAFPATGEASGFDVVLGNPPWDRIKIQEKEWFAARAPEIASAPNSAARRRMIVALAEQRSEVYREFVHALRESDATSHFLRKSGRYPLAGRGDVNTYAVFAELDRAVLTHAGYAGFIVPSGLATDDTTKDLFADFVTHRSLANLYHFENEDRLFSGLHHAYRFCLITVTGGVVVSREPTFVSYARAASDIDDETRRYVLTSEDLALVNPNTKTCPMFRSRRDAEITKAIYRRLPVLVKDGPFQENPWRISFMAMLHMSSDSSSFRTRQELVRDGWQLVGNRFVRGADVFLPLYEAKMIHHYDHRYGDYNDFPDGPESTSLPDVPIERLRDPNYEPLSRYWVTAGDVYARLGAQWDRDWLFGFRNVTGSEKIRTIIGTVLPRVGVGHSMPLLFSDRTPLLMAVLSSFIADYVARQKVGGVNLTYGYVNQFAVPEPHSLPGSFILPRVLELTYTSHALTAFARDSGYEGPPFRWDEERRLLIRCELDALFFHLYGIEPDDVDYIMESFPIVRRNDETCFGEYRTKRLILEIYDRMQQAKDSGVEYQTILDPPPAHPRVAHSVYEPLVVDAAADPWLDLANAAASEAWRSPTGVTYSNFVLFALIDVMKNFGTSVAPDRIRTAVALTTNPALAAAVLEPEEARRWVAAIGADARALPANVTRFATQRGEVDHDWADAVARAKAGGLLVEDWAAGTWSLRLGAQGSGQPWIQGRAAVAVAIVKRFEPIELEQNLVRFAKEVADGNAARAVS